MNALLTISSENFHNGNLVLLLNSPNRNVCISQKSNMQLEDEKEK